MRTSAIIGSIAALFIIAGGVIWFMNTQTDRTQLEQEQTSQIQETAPEPEDTTPATQDPVIIEPEPTAPTPEEPAMDAQDQTAPTEEDPATATDEIAQDTIVVEPTPEDTAPPAPDATDEPAAADTAPENEVEQLLTPEQFDREAYLALIDDSDQLASEDQSRLRALVEGASTNPDMIDGAVNAIRAALDLPPLT